MARNFSSGQGHNQYSLDQYGVQQQQQQEGSTGKKRSSSRSKNTGRKPADESNYDNYNNYNSSNNYSGYDYNTPYNNSSGSTGQTPYYGYKSPYSGDNNDIASYWNPQNGTRSPMFIRTNEVNVYTTRGGSSAYENSYEQKKKGGFFGTTFSAVGEYLDRKFGFSRD